MKRKRILAVLVCILLLTGCGRTDNPYRVDTVVRIPVNPTQAPTEETEPATEAAAETTAPTEAAETMPSEGSSGSKKPSDSKKPASNKDTSSREPTSGIISTPEPTSGIFGSSKETEPPMIGTATTELPTEVTQPEEPTEVVYDPSSYNPGSLEYAILDELNAYRQEAGLEELSISRKLCGIAALRAQEAARNWSHTRPDGRSYTTAMSDYGYGYGVSAENLIYASGSGNAADMVARWMETDSRDNILSERFTTAGIGVYRSGGMTYAANLLVG